MNFTERILSLLELKGVSKNKMLVDLKLAKGSFGNWVERGTIPNGETLSKIAEYFSVSTDYLLGIEEKDDKRLKDVNFAFNNLSEDDLDIIKRTKNLPSKKKKAILNLLDALEEDDE